MSAEEPIDHPQHYGGDTMYEAIKVIEAWNLGFCLGNAVKYISRAGKKDPAKLVEDLEKAAWYLRRTIVSGKFDTSASFVAGYGPYTVAQAWGASDRLTQVLVYIANSLMFHPAHALSIALSQLLEEIAEVKGE